jgi:hypothetical protein
MEGAGVPVPDGLLPRRRLVDGIQRQGHFDEFLTVCHDAGSLLFLAFVQQTAFVGFRYALPNLPLIVFWFATKLQQTINRLQFDSITNLFQIQLVSG